MRGATAVELLLVFVIALGNERLRECCNCFGGGCELVPGGAVFVVIVVVVVVIVRSFPIVLLKYPSHTREESVSESRHEKETVNANDLI